MLECQAKRDTTRDEHRQLGRRSEELADERMRRRQMLEVVEHEQTVSSRECRGDAGDPRVLRPDTGRDGREHELRIGEGSEVDEHRPTDQVGRGEGEPRLARPARPRERHEPNVTAPELRRDRGELELATDELGRRREGRPGRLG